MYVFFTVLIVLAAILLIFVVVIQNSKGGGLAAGFSSSNQVMGVRKTTDFLEKATWGLTAAIVVLSVATSFFLPSRGGGVQESAIKGVIQNTEIADPNVVSPFASPIEDAAPIAQPAE